MRSHEKQFSGWDWETCRIQRQYFFWKWDLDTVIAVRNLGYITLGISESSLSSHSLSLLNEATFLCVYVFLSVPFHCVHLLSFLLTVYFCVLILPMSWNGHPILDSMFLFISSTESTTLISEFLNSVTCFPKVLMLIFFKIDSSYLTQKIKVTVTLRSRIHPQNNPVWLAAASFW